MKTVRSQELFEQEQAHIPAGTSNPARSNGLRTAYGSVEPQMPSSREV
jgi:hypothetical protein